ncbi:MAG: spore maturation protein A [Oscillospiraceae bacterium]|jgi:spore maturation protein A|nr:spore maturation protein A [Oscillospiraceae bacterium]
MALSRVWTGLIVISAAFGLIGGRIGAVSAAAVEGAGAAVELCAALCGAICLWSGIMELMDRSGLSAGLSRLLRPLLVRLFPSAAKDPELLGALSKNVSANLLGLGSAATPAGIRAAAAMKNSEQELCRLVVLNSASIQLIPASVFALRASAGAADPFDILPAVWLSSLASVIAGLAAAYLMGRKKR